MHEPLNPAGTPKSYSTTAVSTQPIRSSRNAIETAATAEHYVAQAALANQPVLIELLREARAALGPEFYDLCGRIDDVLPSTLGGEPILGSLPDLVLEDYGAGFGWFRR